jgi:hypothetical protein
MAAPTPLNLQALTIACIWLLCAFVASTSQLAVAQADSGPAIINVDEFPGTDREKINSALLVAQQTEGQKTVRFTARTYTITIESDPGFSPILGIEELSDTTLEGNGAILVGTDMLDRAQGYFFKIRNFRDLTIKDLRITMDPLPFFQGTVVQLYPSSSEIGVALHWEYNGLENLRRTPNSEIFSKAILPNNPFFARPDNPSWLNPQLDSRGAIVSTQTETGITIINAGNFYDTSMTHEGEPNWEVGDRFVIWKRGAQDAMTFEEGEDLTIENVQIDSSLHYAFKLRGVINGTIRNSRVAPKSGALFSASADGIDVQQSKGITIEDCQIIATGDDMISFLNHGHGHNGTHYEDWLPEPYPETNEDVSIIGNTLVGGNRNGILLLASQAEVSRNDIVGAKQYGLKFTGDSTEIKDNRFINLGSFTAYTHISDELNTGIISSEEWNQQTVTISCNRIEDWHHMPGITLKSIHGASISNNQFIMNHESLISENPITDLLSENKAIYAVPGTFLGQTYSSSDVELSGNSIQSNSTIWTDFDEAIANHDSNLQMTSETNSVTHNSGEMLNLEKSDAIYFEPLPREYVLPDQEVANPAGLAFEVNLIPTPEDLEGFVLLLEIGGGSNGCGIYLIDAVPTLLIKLNSSENTFPGAAPDLVGSELRIEASSDPLEAFKDYSVGMIGRFSTQEIQFAVRSAGEVIVDTYTPSEGLSIEGANWSGNDSISFGIVSEDMGATTSALNHPTSLAVLKPFAGAARNAIIWNSGIDQATFINPDPID